MASSDPYKIKGAYKGRNFETIDTAPSAKIAQELAREYQLAYGKDWVVIVKMKYSGKRGS